jgi:UDP-glucuronate 4-epimerase
MQVLVTGAAGFIGSHVAEALLRRGDDVVGLDNFDPFYDPALKRANVAAIAGTAKACGRSFTLIEGDLRDAQAVAQALRGCDAVIHLAAMAGVRPSLERPTLYVDVNVGGTANLLEHARQAGVRRVVFASSSSVYGNRAQVPFRESDAVDEPVSPYAATKRAGELLCHSWHHLYGLHIACLRFFTVYGPRQRPDLAIRKFAAAILQGREIVLFGDGSSSRDYTWVGDTVQGVLAALAWTAGQQPRFDIFNLGNAHPVSLAELVRALEGAIGRPAQIRRSPMQPGDVERTFASIDKSAAHLGYRPDTQLDNGLRQMVAWLQHT